MTQIFEDQVAIITGGGSGIGCETALLLAERGARAVVIADVDAERGPPSGNRPRIIDLTFEPAQGFAM